jgi:hypothetical protein
MVPALAMQNAGGHRGCRRVPHPAAARRLIGRSSPAGGGVRWCIAVTACRRAAGHAARYGGLSSPLGDRVKISPRHARDSGRAVQAPEALWTLVILSARLHRMAVR